MQVGFNLIPAKLEHDKRIMKSGLIFLTCLIVFYLTLSDSSNVAPDLKDNESQLGNQMDIVLLRTDDKNAGIRMFTQGKVLTMSNSAEEAERIRSSWVDYDKLSSRPDSKKNKPGHPDDDGKRPVYTYKTEVASVHNDKKTAKKFRDKTTVLKNIKRKENFNRNAHGIHNVQYQHKPKKNFKRRENTQKKLLKESNEEPDPIFNIPTGNGIIANEFFEIDPILNILRSNVNTRRNGEEEEKEEASSTAESSSLEVGNFKQQFKELWLQKKYEAINATLPEGDQVNMGGARKIMHEQLNSCHADSVAVIVLCPLYL